MKNVILFTLVVTLPFFGVAQKSKNKTNKKVKKM